MINTALLSYGMSGKVFHAPFLELHPQFRLCGAWERSRQLIGQDYPSATSYASLEAILQDPAIDLVVVNTPIYTHFDYTRQVLEAGKHAVVEKAFTTTSEEAAALAELAKAKGLSLSLFHNRRWDSDFRTVKKVVEEGWLGPVTEATFSFDMYRLGLGKKAHFETPGPGAGLLKDRGSHIIDQALCLFGLPEAVFGDLRITRPESVVDDYFEVLLYYPDKRIRLKGAFLTREPQTAYIVHGLYGSFLKSRGDRQEALLLQGHKPDNTEWCTELPGEEGLLHTERDGQVIRQTIPTEKGNYTWFYEGVYKSITAGAPPPVTAEDGLHIMRIIEAAMESNLQRRVVPL